jgi:hypothetical protein
MRQIVAYRAILAGRKGLRGLFLPGKREKQRKKEK